jgi:hypothetical protein
MAERLAEWEKQAAECERQDAPKRKLAEELHRPHGLFEQALPSNALQERILFRWDGKYIERALRHDLMIRAEHMFRDTAAVANKAPKPPTSTKLTGSSHEGEYLDPVKQGRPISRKRTGDQLRRSREVHSECDPALDFLGWSGHDWADRTHGRVSRSAVDRILNGETKRMRPSTRSALFGVMKKELESHGRLDLLMTSPRWTERPR